MLRDFDIYQTVGNGSALDINFGNIQVRDGSLTIQMTASVDAGTLSGIVVKKAVATTSTTNGSDYSPPTAPSNVATSTVTDRAVTLKWSASTDNVGVAGYYVYRDGAPVGYVAGAGTSYADQGLKANTTYSYTVVAVDAAGNQAPSTVLPVKTYAIAGALTITWAPPAQRVSGSPVSSTDISGYVVRYKLKSASTYQTVSLAADATTYTSPSLVGDYEFDLAAVDRVGTVGSYLRVQF
jgi:chitin-binding protein